MFTVIVFLLIAIVCGIATYREFRKKNFFAVGFAAISLAVFGFFSVMTIFSLITTGDGIPVANP